MIAVATLLTTGAAFLTARSTQQQVAAAHAALGVATLEHLEEEFADQRMRATRREAVKALLKHKETRAVEDGLDFFETVALLVHRDAVDAEMVWNTFYYWIDGYAQASDPVTAEERQRHPDEWKELDTLRVQVGQIEVAKSGKRGTRSATPDELQEFLVDESGLE